MELLRHEVFVATFSSIDDKELQISAKHDEVGKNDVTEEEQRLDDTRQFLQGNQVLQRSRFRIIDPIQDLFPSEHGFVGGGDGGGGGGARDDDIEDGLGTRIHELLEDAFLLGEGV